MSSPEAATVAAALVEDMLRRAAAAGVSLEALKALAALRPPKDDLVSRVEKVVAENLAAGTPSVEATADAVGMSERSLQRHLARANETFAQVVDRVRREKAEHYLSETDATVIEIAFLVGFGDTRSLRRAARRWFGTSASTFRRRAEGMLSCANSVASAL